MKHQRTFMVNIIEINDERTALLGRIHGKLARLQNKHCYNLLVTLYSRMNKLLEPSQEPVQHVKKCLGKRNYKEKCRQTKQCNTKPFFNQIERTIVEHITNGHVETKVLKGNSKGNQCVALVISAAAGRETYRLKVAQFAETRSLKGIEIMEELLIFFKIGSTITPALKLLEERCTFVYNNVQYTGLATRKQVTEQLVTIKGMELTVFAYFKEKGIALRTSDTVVEVTNKGKSVYFPASLCYRDSNVMIHAQKQSTKAAKESFSADKITKFIPITFERSNVCQVDYYEDQLPLFAAQTIKTARACIRYDTTDDLLQKVKTRNARANIVIIHKLDNISYNALKSKLMEEQIISQFILEHNATDEEKYNVAVKSALMKIGSLKYIKSNKIVVGINLQRKDKRTTFGISLSVHGEKQMLCNMARQLEDGTHKISQHVINGVFEDIQKQLNVVQTNIWPVFVIRSSPEVGDPEQEFEMIRQTDFYKLASSFYGFSVQSKIKVTTEKHIDFTKVAAFYGDNTFRFSTTTNRRSFICKYFHGKGKILTQQQMVQTFIDEALLGPGDEQSKRLHSVESTFDILRYSSTRFPLFINLI